MARWTIVSKEGYKEVRRDTDDLVEMLEAQEDYTNTIIDNMVVANQKKELDYLRRIWAKRGK